MNVRVVDAQGRLLAQGRDLDELVQRFRADTRQSISANQQASPARGGHHPLGPGRSAAGVALSPGGRRYRGVPGAGGSAGETVAIELCDYPGEARVQHRLGVLRLLRLGGAQQVKYLRKQLLRGNEFNLVLAAAQLERDALVEDLIDAAYLQAAGLDQDLPYTEAAFSALEARGRSTVIERANDTGGDRCSMSCACWRDLRQKLAALAPGKWPDTRADIDAQLARLLASVVSTRYARGVAGPVPALPEGAAAADRARVAGSMPRTRNIPQACRR